MRADMQKVIVERPRLGSRLRNRKSGLRLGRSHVQAALDWAEDFDSGPRRASSARRDKWLNEHLEPLRRYLAGQVGRPWNKVFSEIRRNLDTRSATGLHIMQHLEDFVMVHTLTIRGEIHGRRCWTLGPVEGLYVHPRNGLLMHAKPRKPQAARPQKEPNLVAVGDGVVYRKLNGIWFRMEDSGDPAIPLLKQQCDSKTVRRIERGELGRLTAEPDF